jgi:hypothetical protein
MSKVKFLPAIALILVRCTSPGQIQLETVKSLAFVYAAPTLDINTGKIVWGTYNIKMHKIGPWRIYEAPGRYMDKSTILYYNYCIFKEGDAMAYKYDSLNALTSTLIQPDTFVKKKSLYPVEPRIGDQKLCGKIDSAGIIIEKYIYTPRPDQSYPDTSYFYFSAAYNHFFYSFFDSLDRARKMKLYRYWFHYKGDDPAEYKEPWPAKDMFWELMEVKAENEQKLLDFMERHKKWLASKKQ